MPPTAPSDEAVRQVALFCEYRSRVGGDAPPNVAPGMIVEDGSERSPVRDLEDADLHDLLVDFYARLEHDPLVGPYFAVLDMTEHMPRIVDFWSTILFGTKRYASNAFLPHQKLEGLTPEHFTRWLETLEAAVDARYRGRAAEEMKTAAHRIAYTMQLRLGIAPLSEASWRTMPVTGEKGGDG